MTPKKHHKVIATITVFAFLLGQVGPVPEALGNSQPTVVGEVTVPSQFSFSIPTELGVVQTLMPGIGPTVIHIQEAHGNLEGDQNIEKILHFLKDEHDVRLVLLEGTAFKLRPEFLRFFPDQMERTVEILEALQSKGLVTGPEMFLAKEKDTEAYGIEDLDAYVANGKTF
jgi:hypothetical protein